MFWLRNKKNNFLFCTLIWTPDGVDSNEMLQNVELHQDLGCLLKYSLGRRNTIKLLNSNPCDPLKYIMDHSNLIISV